MSNDHELIIMATPRDWDPSEKRRSSAI
jgi:hypothetical protein